MKKILILLSSLILLTLFLVVSKSILFPVDILENIRSYNLEAWTKPSNSLIADPVFQFEPWRAYAKERILAGQIPMWNPNNGGGAPFLGNPQTSMWYPLTVLYYILPVSIALNLIPILKLVLYASFCFIFLRSIKCSGFASAIGIICATLSGFPILWLLWPHTNVFIVFPLLLYLTEKFKMKKQRKFLILTSIAYLVAISGGHPETLLYVALFHVVYTWYRVGLRMTILVLKYIVLGFTLGAFIIFPFIEYLLNGEALSSRITGNVMPFFPLKSLIYNIFPFISGAPQLSFYKPMGVYNFQELVSGYVGIGILILFVFFSVKLRSNEIVKFFSYLTLLCILVAYKIWPFWIVTLIPPLNIVPNGRLIGFVGLFVSIVVAIGLSNLNKLKMNNGLFKKCLIFLFFLVCASVPFLIIFHSRISELYPQYRNSFIPFLSVHITTIVYSTILFLYLCIIGLRLRRKVLIYLGVILVLSFQVVPVFLGYNSLASVKKYYPRNEITQFLQRLPKGRVLDVGNMYIPPSINLIYNLQQAQNEDAINIRKYSEAFKKAFPNKGYWNNVDTVTYDSLNKFDIKYVISDYDINLKLVNIQPKYDQILPIRHNKEIDYKFHGPSGVVKQLRLLTANYNRHNDCLIEMAILKGNSPLFNKTIACASVRDGTYLTFNTNEFQVSKTDDYLLRLKWIAGNPSQYMGLRGFDSKPYLGLLYEENNAGTYKKIWSKDGIDIWNIAGSSLLGNGQEYTVISNNPENLVIKVAVPKTTMLEIKKTNYPGWTAKVDGVATKIFNTNPFIGIIVTKGVHIISLSYTPISFYIGEAISLIGLLLLVIPLLRRVIYLKKTSDLSKLVSGKLSANQFQTNFVMICTSFVISVLLFVVVAYILHLKFVMPDTTAINWLTVHRYPKQQDIFYFVIGVPFVTISTISLWLLILCRKKLQ